MKRFCVIALLLAYLISMSGCLAKDHADWWIEQSPVTGKYYEMRYAGAGTSMAEVTQADYERYKGKE
jgi:hypothetical protein